MNKTELVEKIADDVRRGERRLADKQALKVCPERHHRRGCVPARR